MNCPKCNGQLSVLDVRGEFVCRHCKVKLSSNGKFTEIMATLASIIIATPFFAACSSYAFLCAIVACGVETVGAYYAVYKPLLAINVRKTEQLNKQA